jgi:hypothetical protein
METAFYPDFSIPKIKEPSRNWAFPIFGGLVKIIILIPIFVEIALLMLYIFFLQIINSFYVLFNKKYWQYCFDTTVKTINLIAQAALFFAGLSNKYPDFSLKASNEFELKFTMPINPSPLFAFPIFGGIARGILIIPFAIYSQIIANGARVGVVASSIPVFFKGRYPDSTYELAIDALRLQFSELAYFAGISDKYPSFKINMNHQTAKIALIIIGTIILITQWKANDKSKDWDDDFKQKNPHMQDYPNRYIPPVR